MKKLLALVVAVLLLMSACSSAADNSETNNGALVDVEHHGKYRTSHNSEEYRDYLNAYSDLLPENFVHLDNLLPFGHFDFFIPFIDGTPNQYKYCFRDYVEGTSVGRYLDLTITHLTTSSGSMSTSEYAFATITDDMTSMIKKPASETESVIVRNGLEYYYSKKGVLFCVAWCSDGIHCKISGQLNHKGGYDNSLFKRLISIDETEASAAFEEIKQALNSK